MSDRERMEGSCLKFDTILFFFPFVCPTIFLLLGTPCSYPLPLILFHSPLPLAPPPPPPPTSCLSSSPLLQLSVPLAAHHTLTPLKLNLLSPYPESHNNRQTKHITFASWNRGLGRSPQRSTVKSLISKPYHSLPLKHPN